MTVTADKPGPYAAARSILDLIERYRSRGLSSPIDRDVLSRAGIAQSLIPRTLQALQALDLVDATGVPTPTFEGLRLAPESEFKARLVEWLKSAYADVFRYVDPTTDNELRVRDAFRSFRPIGQQNRMVMLFQGLCAAAGLLPERPDSAPRQGNRVRGPATPRATYSPAKRMAVKHTGSERFKDGSRHPSRLPPPLSGLLESLPAEGAAWTNADRAKFITTFTAVLDFCFPIVEDDGTETETAA